MKYKNGITINGKHTYQDFNLVIDNIEMYAPEKEVYYVDIPGRKKGPLDLSEWLTGTPQFGNRKMTVTFVVKNYENWHSVYSKLLNEYHNKTAKVIFDEDFGYYYFGRLSLETKKEYDELQSIILQIDAEPFKYEINSSIDDWLWDDIDFEEDVIRDYRDLPISGTTTYTIIGSPMPSHPVIESNASMKVLIEGNTFNLKVGKNKIYDILLEDKEYEFTFIGNGKVTIEYRGGKL